MTEHPTPLKAVLFDLDGTLMETAPEIADALNDTLARWGLAPVGLAQVQGWIGDGARTTLARALAHAAAQGGQPPELATAWEGYARDYEQRTGTHSHVHAGVVSLLQRLRARGLACAVLTNKPQAFARKVLATHGLEAAFDLVVGGDTLPVHKPDPAVMRHALAALGVAAHEAVLVGDSVIDVRTARAAGVAVWVVRHGYPAGRFEGADAPDGFIEHFDAFEPKGPAQSA